MISIQLAYICIIFALFLSDTTLLELTHKIQRSKDPKLFGLVVHVYFLCHCISICSIITDICLGSLGQHKTSQNITVRIGPLNEQWLHFGQVGIFVRKPQYSGTFLQTGSNKQPFVDTTCHKHTQTSVQLHRPRELSKKQFITRCLTFCKNSALHPARSLTRFNLESSASSRIGELARQQKVQAPWFNLKVFFTHWELYTLW